MRQTVVLGSINMDLSITTDYLPQAGETTMATGITLLPGGKGANQAVAAARMGSSVRFVGAVGDDENGRTLTGNLERAGIETADLRMVSEAPTGLAIVMVDGASENSIVVVPGANHATGEPEVQAVNAIAGAGDWLVAQLELPHAVVLACLRTAHLKGARCLLNAAPAAPIEDLLPHVDVLVVNEIEAATLLGSPADSEAVGMAAAASLCKRHDVDVVLTRGKRGAIVATAQGTLEVLAHPVDAVDTTGAGDAFVGALVAALADGQNLRVAAEVAVVAGALATTRRGAQTALPIRQTVDGELRSRDSSDGRKGRSHIGTSATSP